MRFTKLTTMAFIKDKHDFLVFEVVDVFSIVVGTNGTIELLKGSDNQFFMFLVKLIDKSFGAGGAIHAVRLECVEFSWGLRIKIITVDHKQHFFNIWHVHDNLTGFKRGQGFAWASSVPDVAIALGLLNLFNDLLHGVNLVGAKYHQLFRSFMHYHVLGNHVD